METVINAEKIQRLLVRGTNWVGDSVMSLPALDRIRRGFPRAHITLMVLPWVSGIYEDCELVDEVLLYDRQEKHRGFGGRLKLIQQLRARKFEAIVLFQNAFEAALLANLAKIPLRIGYRRDARGWLLSHSLTIDPRLKNLHQSYYYLDLVERLLGCTRTIESVSSSNVPLPLELPPGQWLKISSPRKESARRLLLEEGISGRKPIVGVNPGASFGSAKRWPKERYAELLDQLANEQEDRYCHFWLSGRSHHSQGHCRRDAPSPRNPLRENNPFRADCAHLLLRFIHHQRFGPNAFGRRPANSDVGYFWAYR